MRARRRRPAAPASIFAAMAKDTEKLIRQLSLISYLMAERRPVTALEIRRDVEGYSEMNEDAFARRFYADRAELESLGIELTVEKPADGFVEQENYSLPPENFHLPAIEFTDAELRRAADRALAARRRVRLRRAAAPRAPADLLGPPEPPPRARPALGRARHHRRPRAGASSPAPGEDRHRDLPPQDDRVRLLHDGARRGGRPARRPLPAALPGRPVLPRRPLARARRHPRLPALAHPRQGRLRDQGRARLPAPEDFDPGSTRGGCSGSSASRWARPRSRSPTGSPGRSSATSAASASCAGRRRRGAVRDAYAEPRQLVAWVLGLGENAGCWARPELVDAVRERVALLVERHRGRSSPRPPAAVPGPEPRPRRGRPGPTGAGAARRRSARALRPAGDAGLDPHPAPRGHGAPSPRSASACRSPSRSCARTSTSSTS